MLFIKIWLGAGLFGWSLARLSSSVSISRKTWAEEVLLFILVVFLGPFALLALIA